MGAAGVLAATELEISKVQKQTHCEHRAQGPEYARDLAWHDGPEVQKQTHFVREIAALFQRGSSSTEGEAPPALIRP
jgi:hypothetical protein